VPCPALNPSQRWTRLSAADGVTLHGRRSLVLDKGMVQPVLATGPACYNRTFSCVDSQYYANILGERYLFSRPCHGHVGVEVRVAFQERVKSELSSVYRGATVESPSSIQRPDQSPSCLPRMKFSVVATGLLGLPTVLAECQANNCIRGIRGTEANRTPPLTSRLADCSSFMLVTVTPAASSDLPSPFDDTI
jgi:hypothetical protein